MEHDNHELLFQIVKNQADFEMAVIELRAELQSLRAAIALHIAVPEKREAFLEAVETMRSKILESLLAGARTRSKMGTMSSVTAPSAKATIASNTTPTLMRNR